MKWAVAMVPTASAKVLSAFEVRRRQPHSCQSTQVLMRFTIEDGMRLRGSRGGEVLKPFRADEFAATVMAESPERELE